MLYYDQLKKCHNFQLFICTKPLETAKNAWPVSNVKKHTFVINSKHVLCPESWAGTIWCSINYPYTFSIKCTRICGRSQYMCGCIEMFIYDFDFLVFSQLCSINILLFICQLVLIQSSFSEVSDCVMSCLIFVVFTVDH